MLGDPEVEQRLPLSLGGPAGPTAEVGIVDGRWCLYRLDIDGAAYSEFVERVRSTGEPFYPEHRWQFLVHGEILLAADDREGLRAALERADARLDSHYQVKLRRPPSTSASAPSSEPAPAGGWWSRLWRRRS